MAEIDLVKLQALIDLLRKNGIYQFEGYGFKLAVERPGVPAKEAAAKEELPPIYKKLPANYSDPRLFPKEFG